MGKNETTAGIYNFAQVDPFMQVFSQNKLAPLLILDYNNPFYDNNQTPYDEVGFTAFANYARALVSYYGPELKAVEVYNEYNGTFSNGPYAATLYAMYRCYVPRIRPLNGATRCDSGCWGDVWY